MLVQPYGAVGVKEMSSTFKYSVAALVCFARAKLEKINVVWHSSGTLFYKNLYERQHDDRIVEEAAPW